MKKSIYNTYIVDSPNQRVELGFPTWSGILKWSEDLFVNHNLKTIKYEWYNYNDKTIEIENRFYLIFNNENYDKAILLLSSKNRWIQGDNEK